jgi:hypothetical protein
VLVVIDTLARCARIEENSSSDMGEVVAACDRIRAETSAAVLLIHHPGKEAKKGARGSSALRAAVDSEIEVQIKCGDRAVWVTKQRNGPAQFGWPFKLEEIEVWRDAESDRAESACTVEHGAKSDGKVLGKKLTWGSKKKLGPNQQRLRDALEAQYRVGIDSWDRADLRQLARATIRARSSIQSAIDGLIAQGVLAESIDRRLVLPNPPRRAAVPASVNEISAESSSNVNLEPQLPKAGPAEPDLGEGEQADCSLTHINVERIEMRRPYEV